MTASAAECTAKRRFLSRTMLGACAAALTLWVLAGVASANPAAGAEQSGNTDTGMSATMWFVNLNTSADHTYHSNDSLWVIDPTDTYWVETGAVIGQGQNYYANPTYYWADNRPGGGYHEHYWTMGNAPYSTYFTAQIVKAGSGVWDINDAGNTGTSTASITSSNLDQAGAETTDTSGGKLCIHNSSLQWYNSGGVAQSGLPSTFSASPPYMNWITNDTAERTYLNEASNC